MGLHVGQVLWWVPSHRHDREREVTVEKVGRKWASVTGRHRINIVTLYADGGEYSSPGRCYLTQEEWDSERELTAAWDRFWFRVRDARSRPSTATIEDIRKAAEVLGINLDAE